METKLSRLRFFANILLLKIAHLPPLETNVYVRLHLKMLRTGGAILNNSHVLAFESNCSVEEFKEALELLTDTGYIIVLEDGSLWDPEVAKELNSIEEDLDCFNEDLDNLTLHEDMEGKDYVK
ncbi:DUF1376 domain-containing protein [Bartonella rattaustraliani]|uniref:DUF1376 domain-containing protein n=1 Tax=Bartonella rattaustraliani TaxID=481139 RepID=UPI000360A922|nr:DUF1376 domain-containing protein [Bartonella rattaustraliani]